MVVPALVWCVTAWVAFCVADRICPKAFTSLILAPKLVADVSRAMTPPIHYEQPRGEEDLNESIHRHSAA